MSTQCFEYQNSDDNRTHRIHIDNSRLLSFFWRQYHYVSRFGRIKEDRMSSTFLPNRRLFVFSKNHYKLHSQKECAELIESIGNTLAAELDEHPMCISMCMQHGLIPIFSTFYSIVLIGSLYNSDDGVNLLRFFLLSSLCISQNCFL